MGLAGGGAPAERVVSENPAESDAPEAVSQPRPTALRVERWRDWPNRRSARSSRCLTPLDGSAPCGSAPQRRRRLPPQRRTAAAEQQVSERVGETLTGDPLHDHEEFFRDHRPTARSPPTPLSPPGTAICSPWPARVEWCRAVGDARGCRLKPAPFRVAEPTTLDHSRQRRPFLGPSGSPR
jgi:hypothetical protein